MEDESTSVVNYVPSFARGLNILLLDSNNVSLMYLSSLLEQYSFKVTATDEMSMALSMIRNHETQFKLVMVKVDMPGRDALSFLNLLHEKEIPVVLVISSGGFDDAIWKELAKGSCYFLEEPILLKDLKYLWQHVYHSKPSSRNEVQDEKSESQGDEANEEMNEKEMKQREEITKPKANETEERREHKVGKRSVWTPELHKKFTDAVALLDARPKEILKVMNVPNLTARQISSHMQKFKYQLQHNHSNSNFDSPSLNTSSCSETLFPFLLGSTGLPGSTAPLNESQIADQFDPETQELDIHKVHKALGNPYVANEFPTELANCRSQSPGAVGNPPVDAATEYDDITRMLEGDCDANNYLGNELNQTDLEQYSEMLRTVLEDCSNPSRV